VRPPRSKSKRCKTKSVGQFVPSAENKWFQSVTEKMRKPIIAALCTVAL